MRLLTLLVYKVKEILRNSVCKRSSSSVTPFAVFFSRKFVIILQSYNKSILLTGGVESVSLFVVITSTQQSIPHIYNSVCIYLMVVFVAICLYVSFGPSFRLSDDIPFIINFICWFVFQRDYFQICLHALVRTLQSYMSFSFGFNLAKSLCTTAYLIHLSHRISIHSAQNENINTAYISIKIIFHNP